MVDGAVVGNRDRVRAEISDGRFRSGTGRPRKSSYAATTDMKGGFGWVACLAPGRITGGIVKQGRRVKRQR